MPTYAYACTACDHRFETVQAFSDPSLTDCPECTGKLRKLFNSVGIVFKGSGFYRTDSRDSGAKSSSTSGDSSSTTSSSDSSSSSGTSSSTSSSSGTSSSTPAPAKAPAASSSPAA